MTDIIAQRIIDGAAAALADIQGLTGGVHQERVDPFSKAQTPAINIFPSLETPQPMTKDGIVWTMQLRVAIVVRGAQPSGISAQFSNAVHQAMIGLGADDAFDTPALVQYVAPSAVQYDILAGDGALGVVARDYLIQYRTAYDDLTAQG